MVIIRSPKHQAIHESLSYSNTISWDLDDLKRNLTVFVKWYGGDPEQPEYKAAMESLDKAMEQMKIVHENIRELARETHLEELARAKAME